VCVMAVPFAVAETVFVSTTVELRVPVASPLAPVGPAGSASVLPLPVAARTTVAPLTGLPAASFTVTVIVDLPPPAAIADGAAATVDWPASGTSAVTVTTGLWVTGSPFAVAVTVLAPAIVDLSVPLAVPLASVGPAG